MIVREPLKHWQLTRLQQLFRELRPRSEAPLDSPALERAGLHPREPAKLTDRGLVTHKLDLKEEAENCRRQALAYLGKPEASFLLRVGRAFDKLSENQAHRDSR